MLLYKLQRVLPGLNLSRVSWCLYLSVVLSAVKRMHSAVVFLLALRMNLIHKEYMMYCFCRKWAEMMHTCIILNAIVCFQFKISVSVIYWDLNINCILLLQHCYWDLIKQNINICSDPFNLCEKNYHRYKTLEVILNCYWKCIWTILRQICSVWILYFRLLYYMYINAQRNRRISVDQAGIEHSISRLRQHRHLQVDQHARFMAKKLC